MCLDLQRISPSVTPGPDRLLQPYRLAHARVLGGLSSTCTAATPTDGCGSSLAGARR
jgi:hypothetical protein